MASRALTSVLTSDQRSSSVSQTTRKVATHDGKSNPGFSGLQLSYGHLGGVGTGAVTRKERDHDEQEAS